MTTHTAVILTILGYYVFSSGAGAMLPPDPGKERSAYGFLYRFAQNLAANAHRLADNKIAALAASAEEHVRIERVRGNVLAQTREGGQLPGFNTAAVHEHWGRDPIATLRDRVRPESTGDHPSDPAPRPHPQPDTRTTGD